MTAPSGPACRIDDPETALHCGVGPLARYRWLLAQVVAFARRHLGRRSA